MGCPRGLLGCPEEFIVVFQVKMSQIDTENDNKNQNSPIFEVFMHVFKFSTDFVICNVETGQQEKNVLSSMR